jgi:hypothetical protein
MGEQDLLFTGFQHRALRSLGALGVRSLLLFSLPGSDNSVAYPIQAPFEGGQEESRIESCFFLWVFALCSGWDFLCCSFISPF